MYCNWPEHLRIDNSVMGAFCKPEGSGLSLQLQPCYSKDYKIKGCDKGAQAQAGRGISYCRLVERLTASIELSYVRSAVSNLNRRLINQPAQPQRHSKFLQSCCLLLIFSSSLSSTLFLKKWVGTRWWQDDRF